MIEQMGEDEFYSFPDNDKYRDLSPPICFFYIWSVFHDLYKGCKEKITFVDIDCYCRLKHIELSQYELELIDKMGSWAADETEKLRSD